MNEESLGRIVEMQSPHGGYKGVGKVVGYQPSPTFVVLTPGGKIVWWKADLCIEPGLSAEATEELFARVKRSKEK